MMPVHLDLASAKALAELVLVLAVALTPLAVVAHRIITRKGIGVRAIQYIAVGMMGPAILLLTLKGLMLGETTAAIFSATLGYLLAQISKFDDREKS